MKVRISALALSALVITGCTQAQLPTAHWEPASSTATGVTGNVATAGNSLTLGGHPYALRPVRTLDAAGLTNAAKLFSATLAPGATAQVYAVDMPANLHLKNSNTLCDKEAVHYVVALVNPGHVIGRELELAFFSGTQQPDLRPQAVDNSTALCGTYGYAEAHK